MFKMWHKRHALAIVPVIIVGWLNIQCTEGFGISSFGKANTDPPKPATTSAAPGKNFTYIHNHTYRQNKLPYNHTHKHYACCLRLLIKKNSLAVILLGYFICGVACIGGKIEIDRCQ